MAHKKGLSLAIRSIISLSLLALLLYIRRGSLGPTIEAVKAIKPIYFISSCGIFIVALMILGARLKMTLRIAGLSMSYPNTASLTFIGYFFNNFLPTSIGGDVVKAYYVYKKSGDRLKSFISVFMDRFIGSLGLLLLAAISIVFSYGYIKTRVIIWFILGALAILSFLFIALFNKRLRHIFSPIKRLAVRFNMEKKIEELYKVLDNFKHKKGATLGILSISFLSQITCFSMIYLLSKGMGRPIPLKMVFLLMPIVSIVSMLPSINGLGVREGAIYFLFSPYIGGEGAFVLSIMWLFMLIMASFVGVICYMLFREGKNDLREIKTEVL